MTDMRFLVVEDQGFQRWILANTLAAMGAGFVYSAADGAEALKIAEDGEPPVNIIITDLDMPGMDGLEFIRHLGRLQYPASLIVASAMQPAIVATVETMAREYGVPLLAAIAKPVSEKKLRDALASVDVHRALEAVPMPQFALDEIAAGLARGEFVPYFQPQVDPRTDEMKGAEALVRWRHPQFQMIRPGAFMGAIEASPLLEKLTSMMVVETVKACAEWRRAGIKSTTSINVAVRSLQDATFADRLLRLVNDYGLEPRDLIVEVTETAAEGSVGEILENFGRLRMRGFGLSIDDFGTGYSSMERLARVPFTELKIDRSFVANASSRPPSRAMLESSLEAAVKLGIKSVAEGVENRAEWELVRSLKCDLAQGYFVARPMESAELVEWAREKWRATA